MKRSLRTLLLALLVLMVCAGTPLNPYEGETLPQQDSPQQESSEQMETEQREPVPPDPEPPEPSVPAPTTPLSSELGEMLKDSAIALAEAPDFYELTALPELEGMEIRDAALDQEGRVILLTGDDQIQRLDLETGLCTPLCRLEPEETAGEDEETSQAWISYSLLWTDPLIVASYGYETRYIRVEEDGTTLELPSQTDGGGPDYGTAVFTQEYLYDYQEGSGIAYRYGYDGTEQTEIGVIPAEYLYVRLMGLSQSGQQLIFQAQSTGEQDPVTLVMELSDGEISAVYEGWDGTGSLCSGTQLTLEYPEEGLNPCTVTAWYSGAQVSTAFDLSWLAGEGEAVNPYESWVETPRCGTPWGRSLLEVWEGERCRLLLWDYSGEEPQSAPVELTEYVWPVYDLGELTRRAEAMEERYGVRIYLGQEAALAPFPDYTLEASEDLQATSNALDVLETALSYYPEDYLSQLGGDTVRAICFYFCGRMTPVNGALNIDDPGGLACQVDGLELLAFNVTYIRAQDVVHELTHVLDHWLWAEGTLDEETWSSMNPEDFCYYYAYIDQDGGSYEYSGSTAYTTWDEAWYSGETDSVYFIDPYSTTYPTEDRARLMEYLFLADAGGTPDTCFQSVHLQEKLTYYFQCIRDTFVTAQWPEETQWEQALAGMAPEQTE